MSDVRVVMDDDAVSTLLVDPTGEVGRWLAAAGGRVAARARTLAPVDTGRLRDSIDSEVVVTAEGLAAHIGPTVESKRAHIARYVELGTSRQPPRAFLRPALEAARD